jgi:FlgD Ig-like domain
VSRAGLLALALVLLIGCAAAFARSERLKLERSPVARPKFERYLSPSCSCSHATSTMSVLLRRPERIDVSMLDTHGKHLATLVEGQEVPAGRASFEWNGHADDGQVVPDGVYRVEVRLENEDRTVLMPRTIVVDSVPPQVRTLEAVSGTNGILVRYRTDESVRAFLLWDGKRVAVGVRRSAGRGRLTWQPTGAEPTAGLALTAVDRAGNRFGPVPIAVAVP